MREYNEKQLEVIESRDCNILVSAAAGSGKTTVLVERIIRKILDSANPLSIDEVLVLTFTKAAASEMRERILKAVSDALRRNPSNEHLQKQAVLIHNAQITTIDSFCLNILKNNFAEIGLEPGFRPAGEAEMKFIAKEVLDDTVEKLFSNSDIRYFDEFLDRFENKDSISKIKDAIEKTYACADNAPFFEDYIEARRHDYDVASVTESEQSGWFAELFESTSTDLEAVITSINIAREYALDRGLDEYAQTAESDLDTVSKLLEAKDYAARREAFMLLSWQTLKRTKNPDEAGKAYFRDVLRKQYKAETDRIAAVFTDDIETIAARMQQTNHVVNALLDAVTIYNDNLTKIKRKKNIITFSDMEHMALRILLDKQDGKYVPSQTAREYRNCYKEIMIDEYQDSNFTQEWLLSSISTEDEGVYNRFMVGDVKQSIYRFRNANPELFTEKYNTYSKDKDADCRRIDLSMNYRSRESVTECVNSVFEKIMAPDLGGVAYDDDSRLYCGASYPETECDTGAELILQSFDADSDYTKQEQEALLIADRIKRLVREYKVADGKDMRPCTYRDIVILLRSGSGFDEALKRIMALKGIPAYITSKSGYFDSTEIVTILNYLAIIDNPYNDIAFMGTLTSVFGEFSADEVALARILKRDASYYEAVRFVCDLDFALLKEERPELAAIDITELRIKCNRFLQRLDMYRKMVPYTPIHLMLRKILADYDYMNYVSALPLGEQKSANVAMLLNKAESFEAEGFKGLFHFNKYIERLHKYGSDDGDAVTLDENADVVRIMTMHKSKGLEFPVCILAGLSKNFNDMDTKEEIVFHDRLGIGLDYVDSKKRAKYRDLRKRYIIDMMRRDVVSEEMRILYVAMTRPKEKLIMTACVADAENILEECESISVPDGKLMPVTMRRSAKSFFDMIMLARGNNNWNGRISPKVFTMSDIAADDVLEKISADILRSRLEAYADKPDSEDAEAAMRLREKIMMKYHHEELSALYTKTSVSELKMAAMHKALVSEDVSESECDRMFEEEAPAPYIPTFASADIKEVAGNVRGSAYHRVMELLYKHDLPQGVTDAKALDALMQTSIEAGEITRQDYELVDMVKAAAFINSDLGIRMRAAALRDELYLEQPFVLGVAADRLNDEFAADETVLIQGIVDVFFIEDGEAVLLDYKTDAVRSGKELIDRYRTQLEYYDEAITRILDIKVKDRFIYSFKLQEIIGL